MVGALPVVCCQVAASQAAAAGQSCHTTRLSDVHPHRRSTPFSTLNKPTGFAYCRTNKRSTTTCACNHIPSKQAQARRTDWQLEATRNTKQDKNTKQVEDEKARQGDHNIMSQFGGLVNELLYGAASRMERGQTTCISCKGSGTCVCANCKGQGIMQAKQLQKAKDPVRQAANKVQSMLGGGSSSSYSTSLRSNRCPKCHGNGQLVCSSCEGRGFRGDFE